MIKLLHTADLHIGLTFNTRAYGDGLRNQLVKARFQALERVIESANESECDLLVIAGDLFERVNIQKQDVSKTAKICNQFSGKCIAVLPGNHDYYDSAQDLWIRFIEGAPDNLLLLSETNPYKLNKLGFDIDAVLYPAPCTARHSAHPNIQWIGDLDKRPQAKWHIGIAHGSLNGVCPDLHGRYYIMDQDSLRQLGLDLWLLGHSHVRYPDRDKFTDERIIYSGTPEPDGFDCEHAGNYWRIILDENVGISGESGSPGKFRFREINRNVYSGDELLRIRSELETYDTESLLLKLNLSGRLSREDMSLWNEVFREIKESAAYAVRDDSDVEIEITGEIIDEEFTQGSLPHNLLTNLLESQHREALQIAFELIQEVRSY